MARVINLWSSPRNISTALLYAFAQHPQVTAVDEPLYGHYLRHQPTALDHPGAAAIKSSLPEDTDEVAHHLLYGDWPTHTVVAKQMTHHLVEPLDWSPFEAMDHVLLIRDPRLILASFAKVAGAEQIVAEDVGLPQQVALAKRLHRSQSLTAVVDAARLLQDPKAQLRGLCHQLSMDFDETMLSWPAGAKSFDGVWASHWYGNAHKSTGFGEYRPRQVRLSPKLEGIAQQLQPMYEELLNLAQ